MLNRASTYTGCTIWMLPLLFVLYTSQAEAQNTDAKASPDTYSFIFKGEPIEYALQQLVKKTHMDLIYDPDIIPEHSVFSKVQGASPEGILRQILQDSPLDFIQLSSGTYVLIAAPRKKAMTGHLSGRVIDGQTGQPLAGANVMLADASGGAVTSGNGHFSIPELSSGYHELTITYVGYQAVRDTVWVPANASTSLDFSLAMRPFIQGFHLLKFRKHKLPVLRMLLRAWMPLAVSALAFRWLTLISREEPVAIISSASTGCLSIIR